MPRKLFEFSCTACPKVFDFKLNTSLNGNYKIHCPNCGHVHFRILRNGEITEDRFNEHDTSILIENIRPMKSSCRDVSKETHEDNSLDGRGFMHRLWGEKFSVR